MRARLTLGASLLGTVALAALALSPVDGAPPDAKWKQDWKGFPHYMHRSPKKGEENARCEECHVGDGAGRSYGALADCQRCHEPELEQVAVERAAVKRRVRFEAFEHGPHVDPEKAKMVCSDCHAYRITARNGFHPGRAFPKPLLEDGFAPPDLAMHCTRCHEPHDAGEAPWKAPEGERACDECHADEEIVANTRAPGGADAQGRRAFSHEQHLEGLAGATGQCVRCHVGAAGATSIGDVAMSGLRPEACAGCHGEQVVADFEERVVAPKQKLTPGLPEFRHDQHAGEQMGCERCHQLGPNGVWGWQPKVPGLPGYDGCIHCHGESWRVDDHDAAKRRGPIACLRCHTGSTDAGKEGELRSVKVRKARLGGLTVAEMTHPFVCRDARGQWARNVADCQKCHRQAVDPVVSRIMGKSFTHASHFARKGGVAAAPATDDCLACHAPIAESDGPETSHEVDLGKPCAKCHLGGELERAGAPAIANPDAHPGFSHRTHVGFIGREIGGCGDCHGYDAADDRVTTRAEAASCKMCHDHRGGRAKWTGPTELGACNRCHLDGALWKPAPKIEKARSATIRARVPQHHTEPEGACNRCHPAEGGKGRLMEREGIGSMRHTKFDHPSVPKKDCERCHFDRVK